MSGSERGSDIRDGAVARASDHDHPRRLVLAGGGHAHLQVLADWIAQGPPPVETVLISARATTLYSGMIPGWIAGFYRIDEATIELAPLAARAGVRLIVDRVVGLAPAASQVELAEGAPVPFDWLSIATGGGAPPSAAGAPESVIAVQPIDRFVDAWSRRAAKAAPPSSVAVVGGGAAGVEIALAVRTAFPAAEVRLIAGTDGLLPAMAVAVRRRAARALVRRGVAVSSTDATAMAPALTLSDGSVVTAELTIVATGSGAPKWLSASALPLDDAGFVKVDADQRVPGHPALFAAGDAAQRIDRPVAHAGVHAVHAGPVVAANLRKLIIGSAKLACYRPRRRTLYLLSTGDRRAILSWGGLALEGWWVWWLKDWIDRRWIEKFRRLSREL